MLPRAFGILLFWRLPQPSAAFDAGQRLPRQRPAILQSPTASCDLGSAWRGDVLLFHCRVVPGKHQVQSPPTSSEAPLRIICQLELKLFQVLAGPGR